MGCAAGTRPSRTRLTAAGHRVLAEPRPVANEGGAALALVETLEGLLYGRGRPSANDALGPADWPADEAAEADLVFDLTGAREPQQGAIVPLYDGLPGDAARDAVLLEGRAPELELALIEGDARRVLARGLPAIERPSILRFGRDAVADRIVTLVLAVASGPHDGADEKLASSKPARARALPFFAASLTGAARRRLQRLVAHDDHWRIGVRPLGPATRC